MGGLLSGLMGSTGLGSVLGGGLAGLGSFLGVSQTNAQSAANINNQWLANSGLMNQQTTQNWQTMDKQFGMNQQLMDQQANINSAAAQQQFDYSQQQFNEVKDYNTQMANTAYQRSVSDMRAAGLNPILGVASGGAATPGLSANAVSAPMVGGQSVGSPGTGLGSVGLPQVGNALGSAISSAMQGAKLMSGIKQAAADANNAEAQNDVITNQAAKTGYDAQKAKIDADNANDWWQAQIRNTNAQAGQSAKQASLIQQQVDNNPTGPQFRGSINTGIANGEVSGPAAAFGRSLGAATQWLSPISPSPSTTTTTPQFMQQTKPSTVLGVPFGRQDGRPPGSDFAPQSLFTIP